MALAKRSKKQHRGSREVGTDHAEVEGVEMVERELGPVGVPSARKRSNATKMTREEAPFAV